MSALIYAPKSAYQQNLSFTLSALGVYVSKIFAKPALQISIISWTLQISIISLALQISIIRLQLQISIIRHLLILSSAINWFPFPDIA